MKKWSFLSNPFDLATKDSYKKMNAMFLYHVGRIRASSDPFIQLLYEKTKPVEKAWSEAFFKWGHAKGNRKNDTQNFKSLLKELYTVKIPEWEVQVMLRFPKGTRDYKNIFGKGRTQFRRGYYAERLERVYTLARSLDNYPGLSAVRMDVEDFYDRLNKGYVSKVGKSFYKDSSALNLEAARMAAAVRMYGNLAELIGKYCEEPWKVKRYFEEKQVRRNRKKAA
jgi:hypothetical protein